VCKSRVNPIGIYICVFIYISRSRLLSSRRPVQREHASHEYTQKDEVHTVRVNPKSTQGVGTYVIYIHACIIRSIRRDQRGRASHEGEQVNPIHMYVYMFVDKSSGARPATYREGERCI